MTSKHLDFIEQEYTGKTKRYIVVSKHVGFGIGMMATGFQSGGAE